MKRFVGTFLLDAATEDLKSSSLGFPESGLGVHYTPSLGWIRRAGQWAATNTPIMPFSFKRLTLLIKAVT
jgi:hypothetical protein